MIQVTTIPENYEGLNVIQAYCEADDNVKAIKILNQWAHENGFVRVSEGTLRKIHRDGKLYYSGVCYRWTEEDQEATRIFIERADQRMEQMPSSTDSDILLREDEE